MADFDDIGDLYNLNDTNTKLYKEHQEWYDKYKAASIGSLLDNMQSIIERYERAMDNSSSERSELAETLDALTERSVIAEDSNNYKDRVISEYIQKVKELEAELSIYKPSTRTF